MADRFTHSSGVAAFEKLKRNAHISQTRTLVQTNISYPVTDLFSSSCLLFMLTLALPYHSDLVYEFLTNLRVPGDFSVMRSRVFFMDVEFSKADLANLLHISVTGHSAHKTSQSTKNWKPINRALSGSSSTNHNKIVENLTKDARIIQHVIRHSILVKAGDRTVITPLISMVAYYVLKGITFDVGDLIIRYLSNISVVREPSNSLKLNIGLGHTIAYLLKTKYAIESNLPADQPTTIYSDRSFKSLFEGKKRKEAPEVEDFDDLGDFDIPSMGSDSDDLEQLSAQVKDLNARLTEHIGTSSEYQNFARRSFEEIKQQQSDYFAWMKAKFDRD